MRIAICGKMGSGKTYIADLLNKKFNLVKISFAGKVKEIASDLFGVEYKNRELLQNIADKMKDIDNDIWVKYVIKKINDDKLDNVIIDDLRFPNELSYLKKHNFIIIALDIDENTQINRLKEKYGNDYINHINRRHHNSEINIEKLDYDIKFKSDEYIYNNILEYLNTL